MIGFVYFNNQCWLFLSRHAPPAYFYNVDPHNVILLRPISCVEVLIVIVHCADNIQLDCGASLESLQRVELKNSCCFLFFLQDGVRSKSASCSSVLGPANDSSLTPRVSQKQTAVGIVDTVLVEERSIGHWIKQTNVEILVRTPPMTIEDVLHPNSSRTIRRENLGLRNGRFNTRDALCHLLCNTMKQTIKLREDSKSSPSPLRLHLLDNRVCLSPTQRSLAGSTVV